MEFSNPKNPLIPRTPSRGPQNDNLDHRSSDVDSSKKAKHHTLGLTPNQASPGNHVHNGIDSRLISQFTDSSKIQTWTPTWSSSSNPQPSLGNGTLDGWYIRWGLMVYMTLRWLSGSTTTYGTGAYTFSAPFTPVPGPWQHFAGNLKNTGFTYPLTAWIKTNPVIDQIAPASARTEGLSSNSVGSGGWKAAWASNDFITLSGFYMIDLNVHPI